MKWWTSWLVVVGLLSGDFHRGNKAFVSALIKDRNPPNRPGRLGHSRSPKHNSIASYYRDLHRPLVQQCVEPELPERVRDAAAIFTGTVRDMVDDDDNSRRGGGGQTAIVEIKRVVKGEKILDRFTSSPEQLHHRASHHRRVRRMVAVTGLGERGKGIELMNRWMVAGLAERGKGPGLTSDGW